MTRQTPNMISIYILDRTFSVGSLSRLFTFSVSSLLRILPEAVFGMLLSKITLLNLLKGATCCQYSCSLIEEIKTEIMVTILRSLMIFGHVGCLIILAIFF